MSTSAQKSVKLDADQVRVSGAPPTERLFVTAGPGSGKTETVSARIEHLLQEEDLSGNEVLVISFSRAAVEAIQRRQRRNGARSWVWVTTIDSLASRILNDQGEDTTGLAFDARIRRLTELLREGQIPDLLSETRHVIIDEAQDVIGVRANLVEQILTHLSYDVGFTLLGDSNQAIYGFQADPEVDDADILLLAARRLGATEVGLRGQHRAITLDSRRAMGLRRGSRSDDAWADEMRRFLVDMPSFSVDALAEHLAAKDGEVAVLTRSNAQALVVARKLFEHSLPASLLDRASDRSIDPWVADALGNSPASIDRATFEELAANNGLADPKEAWAVLRGITPATEPKLNLRQVAQRFVSGVVPTALTRKPGRITVSTVHRAKGLEFDDVALLDPELWFEDGASDLAKTLYVAITRPRRRITIFTTGKNDRWWRLDRATDRAYLAGHRGKGTRGFEIRGADCRTDSPPDSDGDPWQAQQVLKQLAGQASPTMVDIHFNAHESRLNRPRYDVYSAGSQIGTLGETFTDALVKRLRQKDGRWPDISGAFFTGVETHAGVPQGGPVGQNGLWLSPLIAGPATLEWRRS